jgi:hypothetical protein
MHFKKIAKMCIAGKSFNHLTFLPLLALASCGQPERVTIVKPPVSLTTCADEPDAPSLPSVDWTSVETARPIQRQRDEATLGYILNLRSAFGSCKGTVAGVAAWSEELE